MNEPAALSGTQWIDAAQATVTTLRNAGARNWILVPSPRWSGAHEFEKPFAGASAAQYFATFKDPLEHYAIELHQYADENFSGTSVQCMDPERLRSVMARVGAWSRKHKVPLFLGEFGVANTPPCLDVLRTLLESMKDKDIWLGWTYWSAGAWWGPYPFSIQPPLATPERPIAAPAAQLMVLKPFLRGSTP
jgi:endoglucanase